MIWGENPTIIFGKIQKIVPGSKSSKNSPKTTPHLRWYKLGGQDIEILGSLKFPRKWQCLEIDLEVLKPEAGKYILKYEDVTKYIN